jgi:hypothetical protein
MIQHPTMRLGRSLIDAAASPTLPIESFVTDAVNDPTVTWSGTPAVGELLFAMQLSRLGSTPTHTTPSGWGVFVESTSSNCRVTVYTKVAGASEPTSFSLQSSATILHCTYAARFPVGSVAESSGSNTSSSALALKVSNAPIEVSAGAFVIAAIAMNSSVRADFAFDNPPYDFELLKDAASGNFEAAIASRNYDAGGTIDPEFSSTGTAQNICSGIASIR